MDTTNEKLEQYRLLARKNLRDKRYEHTLAVARLAEELADRYGESAFRARAAGLLHDITKEFTREEQLRILQNSDILFDKTLFASSNVYHSVTASIMAKTALGIQDEGILNAIRYHTTGREGMSLLEKIIYAADAVSYDRSYAEAEGLRRLAFQDLDRCVLEILLFTIQKLVSARCVIAVDTVYCYNELCQGIGAAGPLL